MAFELAVAGMRLESCPIIVTFRRSAPLLYFQWSLSRLMVDAASGHDGQSILVKYLQEDAPLQEVNLNPN